ncbi:MAG: two-component regulator propeller domain-containing protein [Pseudomonadota bacterium]
MKSEQTKDSRQSSGIRKTGALFNLLIMITLAILPGFEPGLGAEPRPMTQADVIHGAAAEEYVVWLATTGGVLYLNTVDGTWVRYTVDDGLPTANITAVAVTPDGNRWFGTNSGAALFDGTRWMVFTSADGLLDNDIRDIAVDKSGTIWFATATGLTRYDGRTWNRFPTAELGRLSVPDPGVRRLFSFKASNGTTPVTLAPARDRGPETDTRGAGSQAPPAAGLPRMETPGSIAETPVAKVAPVEPEQGGPQVEAANARADAAAPEPGADLPYTILIGTYETLKQAFSIASRFKSKGDDAFTSESVSPSGAREFQVFMGNFSSREKAMEKVLELRRRLFRQADISVRRFTVQAMDCNSFVATEDVRLTLKAMDHMPYGIRCPDSGYGRRRILVGAYGTLEEAQAAASGLAKAFPEARALLR